MSNTRYTIPFCINNFLTSVFLLTQDQMKDPVAIIKLKVENEKDFF